mmetsp:Transcript_64365/g.207377  ORF Transcript_64365/g.207377 Transcript_64365/m.207377 type:complete len:290 (+) Transcript_64365:987-1856(+)
MRKHIHALEQQPEAGLPQRHLVLLHLPRLQVGDPFVRRPASTSDEVRRLGELVAFEGRAHGGLEPGEVEGQGGHELGVALGHRAAAEGHRSVHEVPQVVAEVRVVHEPQAFLAELDVAAELGLTAEVPTDRIARQLVQKVVGVYDIAITLGHLPTVRARDEPMDDDALGQRDPRAHEHRRPNDTVEPADVLAHDVHVCRPETAERLRGLRAIDAADVVDQGVEPDVHHVLLAVHGVLGARHAPVEGAAADGEVAELHAREALHDLAAVLRGHDELWVVLDVLQDGLLIL